MPARAGARQLTWWVWRNRSSEPRPARSRSLIACCGQRWRPITAACKTICQWPFSNSVRRRGHSRSDVSRSRYPSWNESERESATMIERVARIAVVGVCGSGKTTIVEQLRRMGYDAYVVSQEHSIIRDLWNHREPAALVFLEARLETVRARRNKE